MLTDENRVENTLDAQSFDSHTARIVAFGCGGGGSNTITRLTEMDIKGAVTVSANTDARHLTISKAHKKILIGKNLTRGLGAGGYPEVGEKAAEESKDQIRQVLEGCDLLFITCGLGGGTGTGSAPVVAKYAKDLGSIVIATVTIPFKIEGARIHKAEDGLEKLRKYADTVIVIENQKLVELAGKKPLKEAFAVADNLIATMIKGISETISQPSLVNLDYADVRTIMKAGGVATIGVGDSSATENRARDAIVKALSNPLLDVDYNGATGALIQVIGGEDLRLDEIDAIGSIVAQNMNPEALVMWGARVLPEFDGRLQVITVVTGVKSPFILGRHDTSRLPDAAPRSRISKDLGIEVII